MAFRKCKNDPCSVKNNSLENDLGSLKDNPDFVQINPIRTALTPLRTTQLRPTITVVEENL